jgi:cell wall integrity and stress response component
MHPQQILATLALALPALVGAFSPAYTKLGCYSTVPDVKGDSTSPFQSLGMCVTQCATDNYKIAVLSKGDHCSCSNALPPDSSKVDDDKCNTVCPGYPTDKCGGDNAYSVLSTGQGAADSGSDGSASVTQTAATAAGGIVVAATNVTPSTVPTSILTAPGTSSSKAGAASSSAGAAVTAASSSAAASPTANAAGSLRGGSSVTGVLVAALGLLL